MSLRSNGGEAGFRSDGWDGTAVLRDVDASEVLSSADEPIFDILGTTLGMVLCMTGLWSRVSADPANVLFSWARDSAT